ncbi:RTA1 like protein-domain-containing protein [Schizophyllum amplum]|uniref:RTA1 like protein-domain-containing protein n=1 Tax=Schizophyllum amplum TaxID=97359 RepID=A0A550C6I9_9AGAR|nr:RTA1 like protein-domain-containing protein [Auriculariopsis ampla]
MSAEELNITLSDLTPEQIDELSSYGYVPTGWICILFLVLFGITTAAHTVQAVVWRTWWIFPTAFLCGALECLGWAGRFWSNRNILADDPYMIQIVTTIIAPTPLLAANFIIMGRLVRRLGESYSRLGPRLYTIVFCSCDVISLVVQGAGGGIAASADDHDGAEMGGRIMLGGIAFQLAVIVLFTLFALEFFWRYFHDRPHPKKAAASSSSTLTPQRGTLTMHLKLIIVCLGVSTVLLCIRAVYRTIELADGWNGEIITTELWFNVFDAAMIVVAMYIVNALHPGWLLRDPPAPDPAKPYEYSAVA